MSWSAILAVMLAQPPWYQDLHETHEQRADLLRPVAMAIELATEDTVEQAWLVALAEHESRGARYVIEGRCKDGPPGSALRQRASAKPLAGPQRRALP